MQLIHPKRWKGQRVNFAQEKENGIRVVIDGPNRTALTRSSKTDHYRLLSSRYELPPDEVLDCELIVPGGVCSDVSHALSEAPETLEIRPFALLSRPLLPFPTAMAQIEAWGFKPPIWHRLDAQPVRSTWLRRAERKGIEGYVLKVDHTEGWFKLKRSLTIDCVVMSYTISDSFQHYGDLKALKVGVYQADGSLVEVASVGSGFSVPTRRRLAQHPEECLNRVCEIKCDLQASKGRLQFPRFLRWRDDKPASECTLSRENGFLTLDLR